MASWAIAEMEELLAMKRNIRRSVQALELCCSCESVAECMLTPVDDDPEVWLCNWCNEILQASDGRRALVANRNWRVNRSSCISQIAPAGRTFIGGK